MTQETRDEVIEKLDDIRLALEHLRDKLKDLEELGYDFELSSEQADDDRISAKLAIEALEEETSEYMESHYNGDRIAYECALRGVPRWE